MLQIFKKDVSVEFSAFLRGKVLTEYGLDPPYQQQLVHE